MQDCFSFIKDFPIWLTAIATFVTCLLLAFTLFYTKRLYEETQEKNRFDAIPLFTIFSDAPKHSHTLTHVFRTEDMNRYRKRNNYTIESIHYNDPQMLTSIYLINVSGTAILKSIIDNINTNELFEVDEKVYVKDFGFSIPIEPGEKFDYTIGFIDMKGNKYNQTFVNDNNRIKESLPIWLNKQ